MKNNSGWIKLHRQIVENWIWEDPEKLKAWLDILMMVNHEDKKALVNGKLVTIHRGEKLTSILKLSERWRWSRNRVKGFLMLLEEDNMLTTNRSTVGTTLKVTNYAEYQSFSDVKKTTVEPTVRPTDGPTDGSTVGPQTIMNKNDVKNDNNFFCADALKKIPPDRADVEAYCREKKYKGVDIDGFFEYYDMRDWKLTGGLKMPDWTKAIDYWHSKGKKDAEQGQEVNMPYFKEFNDAPMAVGSEMPFRNGLASEVIRRRREKNEQ